MRQLIPLFLVAAVLAGCAQPVRQARERVGDVVRRVADEVEDINDEKVELWRDVVKLERKLGCNIPIGAAKRMLTPEEREKIDGYDCTAD